jgi:hypothetical protein
MITFSQLKNEGKITNLIPVHISKCRCDNYFWHWSTPHNDWVRGEEIPENLKRMYKTPTNKSNYK